MYFDLDCYTVFNVALFFQKYIPNTIELYSAQQQSVQTLRYQITKCVGVARSEGYILGREWAYGLDRGADTSTNKPHCFL